MDKKKGILIISPFFRPNVGGAEAHLDDLCEYLRKHDYRVYVLTYQPLTTRARGRSLEIEDNLEVRRISWFGYNWFHKLEPYPILELLYLTPRLFIGAFLFLLRNRGKINIIYAYGLTAAIVTKFLNVLFKKRAVMGTCAVYNFKSGTFKSKVVRWILYSFDKILPLANVSKRDLMNVGIDENKMQVYNLWIDPRRFPEISRNESKRLSGLEGKFIVLFVGRLIEIKGVKIIVSAAKEVDKNINFVIIGDGPLADGLKKECMGYKNIHFVGRVSEETLNLYYRAADIFVIPSQYEECFGKVIIEALYCGTPVIGANKGAIPFVIDPSVGSVVEPTKENYKKEIEYFYQNQVKLERLKADCPNYALIHFSPKNAEAIAHAFKEC